MQDIIPLQEYINAIVYVNNACIYSDWYIIIEFNELVKKGSFQSSGKLSLFDDCTYEKFYTISECGEKSFIGDYVEILNWKEELRKTCEGYFFAGVSELACRFARKISNADFVTVRNQFNEVKIHKNRSVDKFFTLIEDFFKDNFLQVYSKGINSIKRKKIESLDEFVFKSSQGIFILKFEISD